MQARERLPPVDAVAGFLAAASLFFGLIAIAWRPIRVAPFAIFFALLAAAIGGRHSRLAALAVLVTSACFVLGTIIAVVTENPLY